MEAVENSSPPPKLRWTIARTIGIAAAAYAAVHLLLPPPVAPANADPLGRTEMGQLELPGEIVADLAGGRGERLVLRVALDYRARSEARVRAELEDPAVFNRMRDRINEFFTGRTPAELADPALRPFEKRELRARLNPVLFPDPEEGRIEEVLFSLRSIEGS